MGPLCKRQRFLLLDRKHHLTVIHKYYYNRKPCTEQWTKVLKLEYRSHLRKTSWEKWKKACKMSNNDVSVTWVSSINFSHSEEPHQLSKTNTSIFDAWSQEKANNVQTAWFCNKCKITAFLASFFEFWKSFSYWLKKTTLNRPPLFEY